MGAKTCLLAQFQGDARQTLVHAMHSVVSWFAFAVWEDSILKCLPSLSPDHGVLEDFGERFAFEIPYWDGASPDGDPEGEPNSFPFPFQPLELGEAALREFLWFQLEALNGKLRNCRVFPDSRSAPQTAA